MLVTRLLRLISSESDSAALAPLQPGKTYRFRELFKGGFPFISLYRYACPEGTSVGGHDEQGDKGWRHHERLGAAAAFVR